VSQSKIKNQRKAWKKQIRNAAYSDFDHMVSDMKKQKATIKKQKIIIACLSIFSILLTIGIAILWFLA
jgi:hypothetical protein